MDYYLQMNSVISCIESRIKGRIDFDLIEKSVGFSYRHIRRIFKSTTGLSPAKYIRMRKVFNAAFDIKHSDKSITEIAYEYGFEIYDTFARAFKREMGISPTEYKKSNYICGRRLICAGVFGPSIINRKIPPLFVNQEKENDYMDSAVKQASDSCVLYGVPKVYYGRGSNFELTPFPMCLQSVLSYMGQEVHYSHIMAASGASFRMRWNYGGWDLSAVDIRHIYPEHKKPFELAFEAVGRSCRILDKSESDKKDFLELITTEINSGRPVIALGVVGPPEASIITGYKNAGKTLLGWSLFQDNMEFAGDISFDESGYFIKDKWWDDIVCVMSVGEDVGKCSPIKSISENALEVLTCEEIHENEGTGDKYYGGQAAYTAWADAVSDDKSFPKDALLSHLFEKLMCQGDAEVMLGEGRMFASGYIDWYGSTNNEVSGECAECAKLFREAAGCVGKMAELRYGHEQTEAAARRFAEKDVRLQTAALIIKARDYEKEAIEVLKKIIQKL